MSSPSELGWVRCPRASRITQWGMQARINTDKVYEVLAYGPWYVVGTGGRVGIRTLACGWHMGAVIGIDGLCLVRCYHRNMMNGERRVTYVGCNN